MDSHASVGVAVGAPDDTWKLIVFASTKKFWRLLTGIRIKLHEFGRERRSILDILSQIGMTSLLL